MSQRADLEVLKARLAEHVVPLALELFGEPIRRTNREMRWGRRGSILVRLDRKSFHSFEAGTGGDMLAAIAWMHSLDFPGAVRWARRWLGDDAGAPPRPAPLARPRYFDADTEERERRDQAAALWRAGRGLHGTAGEKYLSGRGIDHWPDEAVRFIATGDVSRIIPKWRRWWRWPAVLFAVRNAAGNVVGVQLVALNDDGTAARHWEHDSKLKLSRGPVGQGAVRFPGDAGGPLLLAEGPETALSVWLATGHETWALLGNIKRASLDQVAPSRLVVACRDDDPRNAPSRKALRQVIARWRREGRQIVEATPWRLSRGDKSDFNDVHQALGLEAVRARIDMATRPSPTTPADELLPLLEANRKLAVAVHGTVRDLLAWRSTADNTPAPFKVISASVGLGKSDEALRAGLDAIAAGHRVVYAAPTHKLNDELLGRAQAIAADKGLDIRMRVWRGRRAEDPERPEQAMCTDLEAVQLAKEAWVDINDTVCSVCPHRSGCSYQLQTAAVADLWFVPHALLTAAPPRTIAGASLLVIDESITFQGIVGTRGPPSQVTVATQREAVECGDGNPGRSADLNAELRPIRQRLVAALETHEPGPMRRDWLLEIGLTADEARQAAGLESKRVHKVVPHPGMTRAELLATLRKVAPINRAALQARRMWHSVADFIARDADASGRLELVNDDDIGRAVRLFGVEPISTDWLRIPTLHIDATTELELLQLRVPHAELVTTVRARAPHMRVRQVVGRTFGKLALEGEKTRREVFRHVAAAAAETGGRWLVVASKAAADAWGGTVPTIAVAHFGGLRGLDTFGNVRGLAIVGRWGLQPGHTERIAGILTGRAVAPIDGPFPTQAVTIGATDGSIRTVDAERHPDLVAERVRRALVEAELLQAIGRGRGVRRSAAEPLDVVVYGNVALPGLVLDAIEDWQPVDADRAMLADCGAWLSSQGDAATVTRRTAKAVERERARIPPCPYKEPFTGARGEPPGLATATYQRAGSGRSRQRMAYDRDRICDPRAWLEARLGKLAHFELVEADCDVAVAETPPLATTELLVDFRAQYARAHDVAASEIDADRPADRPDAETAPVVDLYVNGQHGAPDGADLGRDYAGGIMPAQIRNFVRDRVRASGLRQEDFAARVGISRPQVANALAGRFGLSPPAAARLLAVVAELPAVQGALL